MRNIEETIAKYAVDGSLFRLGSTNHKKNAVPGFFFLQFFSIFKQNKNLKSVKIYMKDAECAETNVK